MNGAHKITARGYPAAERGYRIGRSQRQTGSNRLQTSPNTRQIMGLGVAGEPLVLGGTANARVHSVAQRVYFRSLAVWRRAPLDEVRKHGHVLTPGRYVGAEAQEEDGEPFAEKMQRLAAQLREQQAEAAKLDAAIEANLKALGFGRLR